jgi:hypothetical protein
LICEVQITLSGIAILKKSEQKVYSIMRMASGQELLETFVFSRRADSSSASGTAFPEKKRVAAEKKRIPEKTGPWATPSVSRPEQPYATKEGIEERAPDEISEADRWKTDRWTRYSLERNVAEDAGSEKSAAEVVHLERTSEIVIQAERNQIPHGSLFCGRLCSNEVDSLEGKVASKMDSLEKKVDDQKEQLDQLRAQNEKLIEILKKLEQQREKSSEDAY